ncbi:MAG: hypothetical protein CM1200mP16_13750 [Nitrospina sp.]|nr:MAG: hypothetical protein CM1200mP16_13750 [Nitrospina sp.]
MSVILKPNLLHARKYLAWVYELLEKNEEALKEYNLLLKLNRTILYKRRSKNSKAH